MSNTFFDFCEYIFALTVMEGGNFFFTKVYKLKVLIFHILKEHFYKFWLPLFHYLTRFSYKTARNVNIHKHKDSFKFFLKYLKASCQI